MREHIEMLIVALSTTLSRSGRDVRRAEPSRRQPRVARSTYRPVRREAAPAMRIAH